MRIAFRKIDANASGTINIEELVSFFLLSKNSSSPETSTNITQKRSEVVESGETFFESKHCPIVATGGHKEAMQKSFFTFFDIFPKEMKNVLQLIHIYHVISKNEVINVPPIYSYLSYSTDGTV